MTNTKPFVAVACICQHVLHEMDGVLSAVRIVDKYTLTEMKIKTVGKISPGNENLTVLDATTALEMWCLISLKSGAVTGQHEVSIVGRNPEGKETPFPRPYPVTLAGEEHGANLIIRFVMPAKSPLGLYWFDVMFDGEPLTSIPLRLERGSETEGSTLAS